MTTFSPESRAVLKTSMGDIAIAFLPDKAPRTCEHFAKLARQGFYDGLAFHRVIKDFIVQGGCPRGDGSGGPGFTLRAEFNDTPHLRGVVSMARGTDPHSAGSQFFVVQAESRYLDSRYTAFAKVVEGLDVVDKIAAVPVTENRYRELSTPRDPVFINRIVLEGVEFDADDLPAGPGPAATGGPGAPAQAGPTAPGPRPQAGAGGATEPDEVGEDDGEDDDEGSPDGEGGRDAEAGREDDADEDGVGGGEAKGEAKGEARPGDQDQGKDPGDTDGQGQSESGQPRRRRRGRRGRGGRSGGGAGGGAG